VTLTQACDAIAEYLQDIGGGEISSDDVLAYALGGDLFLRAMIQEALFDPAEFALTMRGRA
jgi:hypothetical protein